MPAPNQSKFCRPDALLTPNQKHQSTEGNPRVIPQVRQLYNKTEETEDTGGSGVVPVRAAYCLKTSAGWGPSIRNTSMIPLSENQCVSTCGISSPFTRSTSLANMFCRKQWHTNNWDTADTGRLTELRFNITHTHTTANAPWFFVRYRCYINHLLTYRFTALFLGLPGWAGARRNLFLDFLVQGLITEADTVTIQQGTTPSRLISDLSPSSPHFYARCPSWCKPPTLSWPGTKYAGLHTQWHS